MAVMVKRKGVKLIAVLPKGHDWTVREWRGRLVATAPDHPPMILGEDGMKEIMFSGSGDAA